MLTSFDQPVMQVKLFISFKENPNLFPKSITFVFIKDSHEFYKVKDKQFER